MREWQPGDVVVGSVNKFPSIRMVRTTNPGEWALCRKAGGGGVYASGFANEVRDAITDLRPLVVIDPEDAEQVERLSKLLKGAPCETWDETHVKCLEIALREFADPKPPCSASLTLGKEGAMYRCSEVEGHAGPHLDGTCTWTAKS